MISILIVTIYLLSWLLLRAKAMRRSTKALLSIRSPWLTRLINGYYFSYAFIYVFISILCAVQPDRENITKDLIGFLIITVALLMDSMCLKALHTNYALEIEIKKSHTVTKSSLYKHIRHPIYLNNIIGFIGLCILINHLFLWVVIPFQIYGFLLMVRKEEAFLKKHLGLEYERYSEQVRWLLIPKVI